MRCRQHWTRQKKKGMAKGTSDGRHDLFDLMFMCTIVHESKCLRGGYIYIYIYAYMYVYIYGNVLRSLIAVIKGDTTSLDYGSCVIVFLLFPLVCQQCSHWYGYYQLYGIATIRRLLSICRCSFCVVVELNSSSLCLFAGLFDGCLGFPISHTVIATERCT